MSAFCITGGALDATSAMDVVRARAMTASSLMSSTAVPQKVADRAMQQVSDQSVETPVAPARRVRPTSTSSAFEAALLKAFEGLDPVLPAHPDTPKAVEPEAPAATPAPKPVEVVKPIEAVK